MFSILIKYAIILFSAIVLILSLSVPASAGENYEIGAEALLRSNVSNSKVRYNTSHQLMIPMFYAFESNNERMQELFKNYFDNFFKNSLETLDVGDNKKRLNDLQFIYFISNYIVLSGDDSKKSKILLTQVERVWRDIPAWQWDKKPFNNLKQRLDWKLNADKSQKYKRAIIDEEFFVFGTAANLSQIYPDNKILKEINNYALKVFKQRSSFEENRWLFDIGSWDQHPTYLYSGYSDLSNIKEPLYKKK